MVKRRAQQDGESTRILTPTPTAFNGPWMKAETLARLPDLARDFEMNRDPFVAAQVRDLQLSETERREGGGDGARMVRNDKPHPVPKPPPEIARPVDTTSFNGRWLAAQYEVARKSAHIPGEGVSSSPERASPARERGPQR
ncbi:MAG: hypothetical protein ACQRW7_07315 [Caulobacterales bacterium]|uniref:hypothetical protein n=1 Tax=Glycocaulis sp. TaxID=1969725 RepID=UPI003F9F381E